MNKLVFTLFFALTFWRTQAQDYVRAAIHFDQHTVQELSALGIETEHGTYLPGRSLTTDLSTEEIQLLRNQQFRVDVLIPDVQAWYAAQKGAFEVTERGPTADCTPLSNTTKHHYPTPANYTPGSMGGYPTYSELLAILDDMHTKYPNLVSARAIVSDTIQTHEGRPLWWLRISDHPDQDEAEPEALYTAMHHCREPVGMTQMLFYMWYLLENYETHPEVKALVDNTELYFIPCVNPDGYLYNEFISPQGGGLWRKNRRDNGGGSYGVDLNRNYGYQWGADNNGSSPNTTSETYRGPAPFSEPETRMIRDFCRAHDFKSTLNYHTYGNLLIYPWSYSDDAAEPYLPWLAGALVEESRFRPGTTSETVGYPVNGSSDDWMYGERAIFSYTPETGPGTFGFWPPSDTIDGLNKVTMNSNLTLGWSLLNYGVAKDLSAREIYSQSVTIPVQVKRYGLLDGPLTVSLQNYEPAVFAVSPGQYTLTLPQMGTDTVEFTVQLGGGIADNSEIQFELVIDNGLFLQRDTLTKIVISGAPSSVFTEAFDSANNWTGDWALTTEDFVSPNNSWTDSPFGNYASNTYSVSETEELITIPDNAVNPRLTFAAKWSIEAGYDWVQISAVETSGQETPLCGQYSHTGTQNQPPGIPLWDGTQAQWVQEALYLDDFKGKGIKIRMTLISDGFVESDGFYIDDLAVNFTDTTVSGVAAVFTNDNKYILLPNPARDYVSLTLKGQEHTSEEQWFIVSNTLGQIVLQQKIERNMKMNINSLSPGMYNWWVSDGFVRTNAQKLVIR